MSSGSPDSDLDLEVIRAEHDSIRIGPAIAAVIEGAVRSALNSRFSGAAYLMGHTKPEQALGDVMQEFTSRDLLRANVLQAILDEAVDGNHFRAMVHRHLHRFLSQTRQRTVVDNLLERAVGILGENSEEFSRRQTPIGEAFATAAFQGDWDSRPRVTELRQLATLCRATVRQLGLTAGAERAPVLYDKAGMQNLVRLLVSQASAPVGWTEIRTFFEFILTAWGGSTLGLDEDRDSSPVPAHQQEGQILVRESTDELLDKLSTDDTRILVAKMNNQSDGDLADLLGVSRPTVAGRKAEVLSRVGSAFGELPAELHTFFAESLLEGAVVRLGRSE